MNLKSSVKVDVGGSVKGATDAAAKAKADVSGGIKGGASAAAGVKADVSGKVTGAKDAANAMKDKATGAIDSAKDAASDAVSAVKAKANAAMDAAKEKAAEMKAQCKAAVDKFKGSVVAPANGWKAGFAAAGSITIGKSFSMGSGITLGGRNLFVESEDFIIRFEGDPHETERKDDKFILYSTDSSETYRKEKTVLCDCDEEGDQKVIKFDGLAKDLEYTLCVDPGEDQKTYNFFENRPYGEWFAPCDGTFRLELEDDPTVVDADEDTFTLFSTDSARSYEVTKTALDDITPEDSLLVILFENLDKELSYTLLVEPGDGAEPYFLFEGRKYDNW